MFNNLPKKIQLTEVGPRDGFQNVKTFIPTGDKIAIIEGLIESGLTTLEITSFVSPKAIPQMADAAQICAAILGKYDGKINASALVPNLRGAQLAWDAGIREITCVVSVTAEHNKANVNRTHEESVQELVRMREALPDMNMRVDLATVFACPFVGWVKPEAVAAVTEKIAKTGIKKFVLCDTIGVATPDRVYNLTKFMKSTFPDFEFSLHLHDTRGVGMVNMMAGIMAGVDSFETSVGGLGGCPFAPGAAGNTPTEDVVNMLTDMGITSGVDLNRLLQVVALIKDNVDEPLNSHMAKAKIYDCFCPRQ
ncbi:MAG: hydroxymethylglutaryl-CoA lyase [Firmicutes bacterium]|nr:hydroxymethylglutaryl-CoA lyase [Bacillota bacterium]